MCHTFASMQLDNVAAATKGHLEHAEGDGHHKTAQDHKGKSRVTWFSFRIVHGWCSEYRVQQQCTPYKVYVGL